MNFSFLLILGLLFNPLSWSAEPTTVYYSETQAYAALSSFLEKETLPGEFKGTDSTGAHCSFLVSKENQTITVQDLTAPSRPSLSFTGTSSTNPSGSVTGNYFLAETFIDDANSEFVVHGQYGVNTRLEMEKSTSGQLERVSLTVTRCDDASSHSLSNTDCKISSRTN